MIPDNLPLLACMFPVPVAVHILATSTARPLLLFLHSDLTRGMQVTRKKSRGMLAGVATQKRGRQTTKATARIEQIVQRSKSKPSDMKRFEKLKSAQTFDRFGAARPGPASSGANRQTAEVELGPTR
jgi:hypothetical protein